MFLGFLWSNTNFAIFGAFHRFDAYYVISMVLILVGIPGGVLSGKVGTGMCGPDRVLFRALRFTNGPFFI